MSGSLLGYLKSQQPAVWQLLLSAEREGLITIDVDQDALTASNRLLWTYPGLHHVLITISNQWTEEHHVPSFNLFEHLKNLQQES